MVGTENSHSPLMPVSDTVREVYNQMHLLLVARESWCDYGRWEFAADEPWKGTVQKGSILGRFSLAQFESTKFTAATSGG